jgi:TctA family transporter
VEQNLVRALAINGGDIWQVILNPITATILVLAAITAVMGFRREVKQMRRIAVGPAANAVS